MIRATAAAVRLLARPSRTVTAQRATVQLITASFAAPRPHSTRCTHTTTTAASPIPTMAAPTAVYRELYAPLAPYFTGRLQVSDIHDLYYEESGNPQGKPVVVLHGGPGGGSVPYYRQYFNPALWRVIMFDQRGAGASTPAACLIDNTTQHLVADIEQLRVKLGIEKWVVFGGSWGSTLSIAYAEAHAERVKALILRGIFMLRRKELLWFYQSGPSGGASFIFPDEWERYINAIPTGEHGDLIAAYYRAVTSDDEHRKQAAAAAWTRWELSTSRLYVDPEYIAKAETDTAFSVAFARIESHFFVNGGFWQRDDQLLYEAHKIAHIPGVIVQGRYDLVCPATSAWELSKVCPLLTLHWVADAGHSCQEQGIRHQLLEACDKYVTL